MKSIFIALALLLCFSISAFAFDVTVTGVNVGISFKEPTKNSDGSALTDLKDCYISYDMGGGWIIGNTVPASSATGGTNQTTSFEVPILSGMEKDVKFKGNARDLSGNVSADSNIITKRIDRLAPDTIQ
jgi:hypothetical protein